MAGALAPIQCPYMSATPAIHNQNNSLSIYFILLKNNTVKHKSRREAGLMQTYIGLPLRESTHTPICIAYLKTKCKYF
jgi:hypothetical protein